MKFKAPTGNPVGAFFESWSLLPSEFSDLDISRGRSRSSHRARSLPNLSDRPRQ